MFANMHHTLDTGVTGLSPTHRRIAAASTVGATQGAWPPRGVIAIPDDAALVLIDIEPAFGRARSDCRGDASPRNNPDAEIVAARLLAEWRTTRRPVIHVRNAGARAPFRDRGGAARVKDGVPGHVCEGEPVYHKRRGSAFSDTTLARDLTARHIRTLVVVGLATDAAIAATVRAASDLAFTTLVVSDATATFDREGPDGACFPAELVHQTTLASLHAEVAIILSSALVLEGLVRAAGGA